MRLFQVRPSFTVHFIHVCVSVLVVLMTVFVCVSVLDIYCILMRVFTLYTACIGIIVYMRIHHSILQFGYCSESLCVCLNLIAYGCESYVQ